MARADYWANPLQDWRKAGDRIECHGAGGDRNVFWLVKEIAPNGRLQNERSTRRAPGAGTKAKGGWAFASACAATSTTIVIRRFAALGSKPVYRPTGVCLSGKRWTAPSVKSLQDLTLTLEGRGDKLVLSADGISVEADYRGG